MSETEEDQKVLIKTLLQEEEYQKKALATIMMKKDKEYRELTEQVKLTFHKNLIGFPQVYKI